MQKLNVAILAGGRSSEHDVSRVSAGSIIESLDKTKYEPITILIERSGDWRMTTPSKLIPAPESEQKARAEQNHASTVASNREAAGLPARGFSRGEVRPATVTSPTAALTGVDVIFPVLHGPYGEDGTIQGLLETAGLAYIGNGVLASAVGMDKAIFKALLRDAGIEVAPEVVAHRARFSNAEIIEQVQAKLAFPVFVKPARLGSSVGISKVDDVSELEAALELAFKHDSKLLVEEMIDGIEVECGVLGNDDPIVSVPGEVAISDDSAWYDFETKYAQGKSELHIPARIDNELAMRVRDTAKRVFQILDCCGLARVDSFVTKDGRIIVNEINTMPGCTPTSAYARLFEASGHSFESVVDKLIELALQRHQKQKKLEH